MSHQLFSFNTSTPAGQSFANAFGEDFTANAADTITALGAYVDPGNPWVDPKIIRLYSVSGGAGTLLGSVTISLADISGGLTTSSGQAVFKALGTPINLTSGTTYSLVAVYGPNDKFYNASGPNADATVDLGSGLVSLAGYGRTGSDTTSFPTTINAVGFGANPYSGPTMLYQAAGGSPTLVVSPSTATATSGGSPVAITATLTGSSASLAATVSGGGTLATSSPTSGTPFQWLPPSTGSGTAIVTVAEATDGLSQTCTITYGPGVTITASPSTITAGVPTVVTLAGGGSSWTSGTRPRIVSGGTNPAFAGASIAGQVISATLNPGTGGAGSIVVGDTTDGATATITVASSPTINAVWDGTSLTYGQNSSSPGTIATARVATVLSGLGPVAQGQNLGVSGQTLASMVARIGSTISPTYVSGMTNILIVEGGHNDYYGGATSAQVEALISSYCQAVLAAHPGWLIVWSLEPPAANPAYPANFNALRNASNAWLLANWKSLGIAALAFGPGIDARIGLDGCEQNPAYFSGSDKIHPTDAGYGAWGQYDLGAVSSAIKLGSLAGSSSSSGSDPWATVLAGGNYAAGTAGAIVLANLNATVSSRVGGTLPAGFGSLVIAGGGVNVNMSQLVPLADNTAITAPNVGNALNAAHSAAAGAESKPNTPGTTTGVRKNADGSTFRTFTYDSGTNPSSRS